MKIRYSLYDSPSVFIEDEFKNIVNNPNVHTLIIYKCKIKIINDLPPLLKTLKCTHCGLKEIYFFPQGIENIDLSYNQLKTLPPLPSSTITLIARHNLLIDLPDLNEGLKYLLVCFNKIKKVNYLPSTLKSLRCRNNLIDEYFNIPQNIEYIDTSNNKLPYTMASSALSDI